MRLASVSKDLAELTRYHCDLQRIPYVVSPLGLDPSEFFLNIPDQMRNWMNVLFKSFFECLRSSHAGANDLRLISDFPYEVAALRHMVACSNPRSKGRQKHLLQPIMRWTLGCLVQRLLTTPCTCLCTDPSPEDACIDQRRAGAAVD